MALFFAGFIFMIAYVNRDASRRRMNSALWTLMVIIFIPTWGLIGLIIYLLMREPLPYPCPELRHHRECALQLFVPTANATCILHARSASARSANSTSSAPIAVMTWLPRKMPRARSQLRSAEMT